MGFWRIPGFAKETLDFDAEARKLFEQLNLSPNEIDTRSNYNPLDAVWKHPTTGAKIYIGNAQAAQSLSILKANGIKRIVNCTDNMPHYHSADPGLMYLRFDVSNWGRYVDGTDASVRKFAAPLFAFVVEGLERGENVMVHCLAGAHRAGTTGVACLMHFARMDMAKAIVAAKRCRPVVDPIGMLPEFLRRLQKTQKADRSAAGSSGSSSSSGSSVPAALGRPASLNQGHR
uniref:protein-tyrosine-phosphatase n=1 Tax=Tetraselmis sp. GSL018 TaxID=582737 RepID=A0A061QUC3_9CHLO|mmetsp:Transcript_18733/g.44786  ORF Transcript_18733/g.44786 Transcript_18733/m.44786 type:complete len:231 (+) Transcript_18733:191-883(+)